MNEKIIKLFENAQSILIVVAKTARLDGVAAALGLSLAAIQQGKNTYVCTESPVENISGLVGMDQISKVLNLGGDVLKVSFPYQEGSIDKVTYNITDDRFNLLVEPRKGSAPLSAKDVQYGYTGGSVELIVTIDAPSLEALGDIYFENPDVFVQEKIVNIDRRFDNKQYGAENLVDKKSSSTSELIMQVLQALRWTLSPDAVTNLYAGLAAATNNFTSFSTNAQSFEAASYLLKNGARKIPINPPTQQMPPSPFNRMNMGGFPPSPMSAQQKPATPPWGEMPYEEPSQAQQSGAPLPTPPSVSENNKQGHFSPTNTPNKPEQKKTSQDWLKPKIFNKFGSNS